MRGKGCAPQLRSRRTSSSVPRCLLGRQNISDAPPSPVYCLHWSGLVWLFCSKPDWVRGQWCLLPHALPATSWDHSRLPPVECFSCENLSPSAPVGADVMVCVMAKYWKEIEN